MQRAWYVKVLWISGLLSGNIAYAQTATWSNSTHDSLWGTSLNWVPTSVPTAGTVNFDDSGLAQSGLVDLGGQLRTANTLQFLETPGSQSYTLQNGTLKLNTIWSTYSPTPGAPDTISANLTTDSSGLNVYSQHGLLLTGTIGGNAGAGRNDFGLFASGNVTIAGNATYTGATTVAQTPSTLTIGGQSGLALSSSSFDAAAGTLILDNSGAANSTRLNPSAPVHLRFGTFMMIGNGSTPVHQAAGMLVLDGGASNLNVFSSGAASVISFQGLARNSRSTLNLSLASGSNPDGQSRLGDVSGLGLSGGGGETGSTAISIVPFAVSYDSQGASFVTYDKGPDGIAGNSDDRGLRRLDVASEYGSTISPGFSSANVRLGAPQTVSADSTINALILSNATASLAPSVKLTVSSGTLAMFHTNGDMTAIDGGPGANVDFGTKEGVIHVASNGPTPQRFTLNAVMSGSGGVTKSGPGSLVLTQANRFTGGLIINQGAVISAVNGAFGSGRITLAGDGRLGFEGQDQTVVNDITVDTVIPAPNGGISYSAAAVSVARGIKVDFAGSFAGDLQKIGAGTLRVTGTADSVYTAEGTVIVTGTIGNTPGSNFVAPGATLGGTGAVNQRIILEAGATLAPGDPTGTLSMAGFGTIDPAATMRFELDGPQSGQYSHISVTPSPGFDYGVAGNLQLVLGYDPRVGDSFTLVDDTSSLTTYRRFEGLPEGSQFTVGADTFQITYQGGDGNDVIVSVVAVPEPCAGMVILAAALCCIRRCRKAPHLSCNIRPRL